MGMTAGSRMGITAGSVDAHISFYFQKLLYSNLVRVIVESLQVT